MAHDHHDTHHVNYLAVFFALCAFTGISVLLDLAHFENKMITLVLVLAVAVAKALCVMMFFMHLKFEGNWKFVLLGPTTILAIGLPLALMPDIGMAYYTPTAPQTGSWGQEMEAFHVAHQEGAHDAGHEGTSDASQGHSEGEHHDHAEKPAAASAEKTE